jgi:hypothetical protein
MTSRRSSFPALFLLAAAASLAAGTGCTEKNMGAGSEGGGGWTRVETQAKPSAPAAPLAHADAVNVTYFYLPG